MYTNTFRSINSHKLLAYLSNRRFLNNLIHMSDEMLSRLSSESGKKVFYFTAGWCGPCKRIGPAFEKIAKDFPDIKFVKIDVDDCRKAADENSIRSVPTFQFRLNSDVLNEFMGASEDKLKSYTEELNSIKP